jgi:hypothetical protein
MSVSVVDALIWRNENEHVCLEAFILKVEVYQVVTRIEVRVQLPFNMRDLKIDTETFSILIEKIFFLMNILSANKDEFARDKTTNQYMPI